MATNSSGKWSIDISDLKKNIADANKAIKSAQAELKNATAGMKKGEETVESLSAQISAQQKIVESEEKKLQALKDELQRYNAVLAKGDEDIKKLTKEHEQAAKEFGENSEQAKKLAKQLTEAQKAQERNKTAAENLNTQIVNQDTRLKNAERTAQEYVNGLSNLASQELATAVGAEDAAGKTDTFTIALGNLAANAISKVIDGLGKMAEKAKEAFEEFDKGRDAVLKNTGAIGDEAAEFTAAYANVAKRVPGSLEKIGETVGEVNTRFGVTGEELEKMSEDFLRFASVTNTDAKTAVQLVSRAMGDAGIETGKYSDLLDELTAASQKSGIGVDKLSELLTSYGAPMRALGFDTESAIAIFAQWEKAGVNTATAFSGMRKAISNWASAGKDASKEFSKMLVKIGEAPGIAEATTLAIEAFGSKAGPDLADAIQGGRFEYEDFLKLIQNSEGQVLATFEETQTPLDKFQLKLQQIRVTVGEQVGELLEKYEPQITKFLDDLGAWVEEIAPKVEALIKDLQEKLPIILTVLTSIIAAVIGFKAVVLIQGIISAMTALVAVIKAVGVQQALLNMLMAANPIGLLVSAIAALIALIVGGLIVAYHKCAWFHEWVDSVFVQGWKDFANWWTDVVTNRLPAAMAGLVAKVKEVITAMPGFFKQKFTAAYEAIKGVFGKVGDFFSGIFDRIKDTFHTVGTTIGDVIGGAFKAAINAIIGTVERGINFIPDAVNRMLDKINELPGVNIGEIPTVSLPRLAKGGVATRATAAIVGEGGENEAIIPLRTGLPKIAAALAHELRESVSGNMVKPQSVNYNFYQTNNSPKALSRWEIYRQTRNQLALAKGV